MGPIDLTGFLMIPAAIVAVVLCLAWLLGLAHCAIAVFCVLLFCGAVFLERGGIRG